MVIMVHGGRFVQRTADDERRPTSRDLFWIGIRNPF